MQRVARRVVVSIGGGAESFLAGLGPVVVIAGLTQAVGWLELRRRQDALSETPRSAAS